MCLCAFSSCEKNVKKETRPEDASGTVTEDCTVTLRAVEDKIGPLLEPYDRLAGTGEYTLKMTVNEVIGGESVPTVTTSVRHNGTIRIKVEESYSSETEYFVEGGRLYFYTADGEEKSTEFDPEGLNIYLYAYYSSGHELVESGETTLYGRDYLYERYVDNRGAETSFLFYGGVLERKLVYDRDGSFRVFTVELTENRGV